MPETKPKFNPNQAYEVVGGEAPAKKPAFNPNESFDVVSETAPIEKPKPIIPTEKEVEQTSVVWSNLNKPIQKSTEKKEESPYAVLEAQMTKDLLANRDNDVYQQKYIQTLVGKGYDNESLLNFRKRIFLENPAKPEMTREEFREIARKNNIKTGQPEMPFIQPIIDWAEDFMVKTGDAIGAGAEEAHKGIGTFLGATADGGFGKDDNTYKLRAQKNENIRNLIKQVEAKEISFEDYTSAKKHEEDFLEKALTQNNKKGEKPGRAHELTKGALEFGIGGAGVLFNTIPA